MPKLNKHNWCVPKAYGFMRRTIVFSARNLQYYFTNVNCVVYFCILISGLLGANLQITNVLFNCRVFTDMVAISEQ